MKTLFKTLFAACAALFLAFSLSGCGDEGMRTVSLDSALSSIKDGYEVRKFARTQSWSLDIQGGFTADDTEVKSFLEKFLDDPEKSKVKFMVGDGFATAYFKWKGGGRFSLPDSLKEKIDTYQLEAGEQEPIWALKDGVVQNGAA